MFSLYSLAIELIIAISPKQLFHKITDGEFAKDASGIIHCPSFTPART